MKHRLLFWTAVRKRQTSGLWKDLADDKARYDSILGYSLRSLDWGF